MNAAALLATTVLSLAPGGPVAPLSQPEVDALVREIDERQRTFGDFRALCYVESKQRDRPDTASELIVFRRESDDRMMLLFASPRSQQGKGYLRIERNLWYYDPGVGRWERRTERDRIGGTDTRRQDFESRLSEQYEAAWEADERLGSMPVHRLLLTARAGQDVAFPVVRVWVDVATRNVLKQQDLALSGRLLRTTYFPRWIRVHSAVKGGDVWYPEQRIQYDELEKGASTVVAFKQIDLTPLDANVFTKAWLEGQSR